MNDTFCGFQFKKMVLSSILMMIAFSLSGIADFVLAAQFFGDNAMAAVNLVTPILERAQHTCILLKSERFGMKKPIKSSGKARFWQ